jgi:hypothetical protein
MTPNTLQKEIEEVVPKLLDLARELTWNDISDNCKFILTEIKNGQENFHVQRQLLKEENDKKIPLAFQEIIPTLEKLYDNLYDINLYIYEATKNATIIDIRYYLKSSLDKDYIQKVINNHPMLHCKVSIPPWLSDKKEKFDINWEHNME